MSEDWRIRTSEAAGSLAEATQESWRVVMDGAGRLQQQNIGFAQSLFDNTIETLRTQAEISNSVAETFAEQAQRQQEAVRTLARESFGAYTNLLAAMLFAPYARRTAEPSQTGRP